MNDVQMIIYESVL